jgi:hypothetical protein
VTLLIITFLLLFGGAGYHYLGELPWVDAVLNAAMILTGMGPVDPLRTTAGKLFATLNCLYSGIAFLTMMAVPLAPVIHRLMHRFHLEEIEDERRDKRLRRPANGSGEYPRIQRLEASTPTLATANLRVAGAKTFTRPALRFPTGRHRPRLRWGTWVDPLAEQRQLWAVWWIEKVTWPWRSSVRMYR